MDQLGEQGCFTADIMSKSHVRVRAINEPPGRIDLNISNIAWLHRSAQSVLCYTVLLSSRRARMTEFALNYLKAEHKCACSTQINMVK